MNKPRLFILICVAAAVSSAFVVTRPLSSTAIALLQADSVHQGSPVPEHVAYNFLFRRAADFRKRAVQAGKPQASNQTLQKATAPPAGTSGHAGRAQRYLFARA